MIIKMGLLIICGLTWTVAYVEAIRVGWRDKSYGMPFMALAFNMSWEIYYGVEGFMYSGFSAPVKVCTVWIFFDLGILLSYLKYGNRERDMSNRRFYSVTAIFFIIFFMFHSYARHKFGIISATIYSAFWSNLVMSFLFIRMFYSRTATVGQSLILAYSKSIGTFSATILIGVVGLNRTEGAIRSLLVIGLLTLLLDVIYIYLLTFKQTTSKKKLWFKFFPI